MTQLVAITHPLTGKTYHMHPDIAAARHHWVHPDPCVPTPAESLPLFNEAAVDQLVRRLATHLQPSSIDAAVRESVANGR